MMAKSPLILSIAGFLLIYIPLKMLLGFFAPVVPVWISTLLVILAILISISFIDVLFMEEIYSFAEFMSALRKRTREWLGLKSRNKEKR